MYKILTGAAYLLVFPLFSAFSRLTGYQRKTIAGRQGLYNFSLPTNSIRIWLHGASVGEIQVIRAILPHLRELLPNALFLVSTMTEQGHKVATKQLAGEAICFYAPLDAPGPVRKALAAIKPDIYVAVETELWPTLLFAAHAKKIRLLLVNGRLSARSSHRYKKIPGLIQPLLALFTSITCISEKDRCRYQELSSRADIQRSGNAKYDLQPAGEPADLERLYRHKIGLDDKQPLLVLGSTHGNEEEQFLQQLSLLQQNIKGLVTIIAPRHLQRVTEVSDLCKKMEIPFSLYSRVEGRTKAVIILDTMGELAAIYAAATYIFCGGSLVNKGGHNIFEGAIMAKPIFYGPYMDDFRDACTLLEPGGGTIQVNNCQQCVTEIIRLHGNQQHYAKMAEANRVIALTQQGAARRQAEIIFNSMKIKE